MMDELLREISEFRQAFVIAVGDKSPFAKIALGRIDAAVNKAASLNIVVCEECGASGASIITECLECGHRIR